MKLSRAIREKLWPSSTMDGDARLKLLVLVFIAAMAGPDVFAAAELTTLLELLGATLFLLAFWAGFRMSLVVALRATFPPECLTLVSAGNPFARPVAGGLILAAGRYISILFLVVVPCVLIKELVRRAG